MKISILMPVFNALPYLEECLNSILEQTAIDWELLAVDDFSSDESYATLEAFAKKDARIKPLRNTQKGIIPALRNAYANSTGDLITRMDADDRMTPNKLQALRSELLQAGPGHLITALVQYFSAVSLGAGYQRYEQWLNRLTQSASNYTDIYRECVIPSPCWMCFREDLDRCLAFQPNSYPEDYDLCFRFYEQSLKIIGVPEVLHYWRDYPERTSRNDEHYADLLYFDLKLPWFLKLDHDTNRPLFLWGAGKKGKRIAQFLNQERISFQWICNQSSKWGHIIQGVQMQSFEYLGQFPNAQLIIAVSKPEDQEEILQFLNQAALKNIQFWFFC